MLFEDKNDDGLIVDLPEDSAATEVLQRKLYYPFGMELRGTSPVRPAVGQRHAYNGKELVEGTGLYAYGFRFYDPVTGRFTGVDPIADQFAFVSGYNYAENSPIANVDLHGLQKTRYDVTWDDPGLRAVTRGKSFEEIKALRDEYASHLESYGGAVLGGMAGGITLAYLGLAVAANPASARVLLNEVGTVAYEALTEQQLVAAGLAGKVGSDLIDLAPGYSSWWQKLLYRQTIGERGPAFVKGGRLTTLRGGGDSYKHKDLNGVYDFIINKEGQLIIGDGHYHMSGQANSVIAAGQIDVSEGVLKGISNQSGHYQPSEEMLSKFLSYFEDLGVDVSKARVTTDNLGGN